MARRRALLLLTATVGAGAALMGGWPGPHWRLWDRALEDQLQGLLGRRSPPSALVVAAVDEATLQQGDWFVRQADAPDWARGIGSLPWPRAAYGRVAERLLGEGAAVVAINVLFSGPSSHGPADDRAMAEILRRHPGRIVLAAEMSEGNDASGAGALGLVRPEPYMDLPGVADAIGLSNTPLRLPGDPMRHPEAYAGGLLRAQGVVAPPSLPLAILARAGRPSRQPDARRWLNPYGPEGTMRRLSAWELLDGGRWRAHPQRGTLAGAMAVVGPTLLEGDDGYPTPYGPLSGVELLATATANSLVGDGLHPWPEAPWARALAAAAPIGLVGILALGRQGLAWRLSLVGLGLAGQLGLGVLLQQRSHLWLPLLAPTVGLVLLGVGYGGDAIQVEGRERRRLRRTFERYVAPGVVAEILADPAAAQGILRGRTLDVTVLFCDLKGFTSLTRERSAAGESEAHVRQLNTYLTAMVDGILAHGGTVDKFIGDAVMAVFGSPVGRGERQEARAAVTCALAMGAALERLNADWRREGVQGLANGIGIASGPAVVGQIGSPKRMEFTVIGDTVNRAARLESLTRQLGVPLLFDRATADRVAQSPDAATADSAAGEAGLIALSLGMRPIKGLGEVEVLRLASQGPLGQIVSRNVQA
ncbi:MAG: adenylate/guanylate cyclase domain-containing protein [Cyanobacteriota bacterium]|nr:adenylate/guanylate cyclase domain-containing protein [Cyanobacteriota bacterium]